MNGCPNKGGAKIVKGNKTKSKRTRPGSVSYAWDRILQGAFAAQAPSNLCDAKKCAEAEWKNRDANVCERLNSRGEQIRQRPLQRALRSHLVHCRNVVFAA